MVLTFLGMGENVHIAVDHVNLTGFNFFLLTKVSRDLFKHALNLKYVCIMQSSNIAGIVS